MNDEIVVHLSVLIKASRSEVWNALVNPETIRKYMVGTEVVSDWTKGSKIIWKGTWKGKPYQDKGQILKIEPQKLLRYSHYSPLSGLPDDQKSYHVLTYELTDENGQIRLSLTQDNNENQNDAHHSRTMWQKMLDDLKRLVEK